MIKHTVMAPDIEALQWLNTPEPLTLPALRGKVVAIHAFQMLCPGCVVHGIPQAVSMHKLFSQDELQVIGLHSVFEHHHVMTVDALQVFIHEYRLLFPIAVDKPSGTHPIPKTMRKLNLQGTPSLVLIDKAGRIRHHHFGQLHDMQVGNMIGRLIAEPADMSLPEQEAVAASAAMASGQCDDEGCRL